MKRTIAIILACSALFYTGCSREVTESEIVDEFIHWRMYSESFGEFLPGTVRAHKTTTKNVWGVTWSSRVACTYGEFNENDFRDYKMLVLSLIHI